MSCNDDPQFDELVRFMESKNPIIEELYETLISGMDETIDEPIVLEGLSLEECYTEADKKRKEKIDRWMSKMGPRTSYEWCKKCLWEGVLRKHIRNCPECDIILKRKYINKDQVREMFESGKWFF